MDTTFGCSEFLFESNNNTNSSTTNNKLSSTDSANRRFKFKPISEQSVYAQQNKHTHDIQFKLNLNNKKEFQKKLLNFDINRNFEDIYWLSLKQEKPKFNTFCDKNFPKRQSLYNSNSTNTILNNNSNSNHDTSTNTTTITCFQIQPQTQSNPLQQHQQQPPPPLTSSILSQQTSTQQQQQQSKNNSGDLTTSKLKKKPLINDSISNTAAVLVDLNRQSINLPLTPIKDDLFKNRYFENYLLNRKQVNHNSTTFNSTNTNQLNTIYFKPNFNEPTIQEITNLANEQASNKFIKVNNSIKLEALEGSRISIKTEELSPRKVLINCTNTTSISTTTNTNMLPTHSSYSTQFNPVQNLLSSKILYKIKEDENLNEQNHQFKQEDKKPILGLNREEPIQTQFRLKPLLIINNTSVSMTTNQSTSKSLVLNEENEHEFDMKKNFPIKNKTKPIKMLNQKLPNSSNNEEITNIINANSDLFSAKATSILTTPPLTSMSTSTQVTNTLTTSNTTTQQQQAINSKTKLAKLIKTDDESFTNRKSKNYIYNTNMKKTDENSSHSSEEESTGNFKTNLNKIKNHQQQQQQTVLHYEDFINYTRVESPHKLGKSMPDGYMFVGSSSIQANTNANTLLNQQFQLFQSQIFDK